MPEPTMSLDEFSERYIRPAMQALLDMTPEELIEGRKAHPGMAEFYDYVLINLYGIQP